MSSELSVNVASLDPMQQNQAEILLERLLAGYGSKSPNDPQGYTAVMISLLRAYLAWAGDQAITKAMIAFPAKPPSYGDLFRLLEAEVAVRRRIVERERRSADQLERLMEKPKQPKPTIEELRAKYPDVLGQRPAEPNQPPASARPVGGHAARVLADLAERRRRRDGDP